MAMNARRVMRTAAGIFEIRALIAVAGRGRSEAATSADYRGCGGSALLGNECKCVARLVLIRWYY